MGQQQILLIVLSVILVGIAVSVGLQMFQAQSAAANQDALIMDIINISALAFQYRLRPHSMGGGGGSYEGFKIPVGFRENDNGMYMANLSEDNTQITIIGISKLYGDQPSGFDETTGNIQGITINQDGTVSGGNYAYVVATYNDRLELQNGFVKNEDGWN